MIQEENIIRQHDNGRSPFKVPEGYFEGFTEKMMNRLQAEGLTVGKASSNQRVVKLPLWKRALRYAAVGTVAVMIVGGGLIYSRYLPNGDTQAQFTAQSESIDFYFSDDELNEVLDYELVDNEHIAYYLTEAY